MTDDQVRDQQRKKLKKKTKKDDPIFFINFKLTINQLK